MPHSSVASGSEQPCLAVGFLYRACFSTAQAAAGQLECHDTASTYGRAQIQPQQLPLLQLSAGSSTAAAQHKHPPWAHI